MVWNRRETAVENLGTDWNVRRKVLLLSLPEGGMFVSITRCSHIKTAENSKGRVERHHRLITCLHIFCFRYLVIGDLALSFVLTSNNKVTFNIYVFSSVSLGNKRKDLGSGHLLWHVGRTISITRIGRQKGVVRKDGGESFRGVGARDGHGVGEGRV